MLWLKFQHFGWVGCRSSIHVKHIAMQDDPWIGLVVRRLLHNLATIINLAIWIGSAQNFFVFYLAQKKLINGLIVKFIGERTGHAVIFIIWLFSFSQKISCTRSTQRRPAEVAVEGGLVCGLLPKKSKNVFGTIDPRHAKPTNRQAMAAICPQALLDLEDAAPAPATRSRRRMDGWHWS